MAKLTTKAIIKPIEGFIDQNTPRVFEGEKESLIVVYPKELAYIRGTEKGCFFHLMDGERLRAVVTIDKVCKQFENLKNFTWGDEFHLFNLDHLAQSTYEYSEYRIWFKTPEIGYARLTPKTARQTAKKLGIPSLKYCIHYKRIMAVCQRYNIRLFDEPITGFSKERLYREFGPEPDKLVMANLLYNLIWQVYTRMQNNEIPEDEMLIGNIRSFWYTYYKSILSRLQLIDEDRYGDMIEAFTRFTADWKLFSYSDWDFWDSKKYNKQIGKGKRINIILVGEKEGQVPLLEILHKKLKVTTIALGGEPSVLSVEYFVNDLEEAGIDKKKPLHIFFATDYDPVGLNMQKSFIQKLKRHYFKNIVSHNLVNLDIFTQKQIDDKKYELIKEKNEDSTNWLTRVEKWVKKTGGIGPKGSIWRKRAYGMEIDACPPGKLIRIFEAAVKPYF